MPRSRTDLLADALVDDLAALHPTDATFWGVPGQEHRWEDRSPEGAREAEGQLRAWRVRLEALPAPVDRWEDLAQHVCRDHVELELAELEAGAPLRDLNHLVSPVQLVPMALDAADTRTVAGLEAVAARLEALDRHFAGYRASLQAGLDAGEAVAARQVRSVIEQARRHATERSSLVAVAARSEVSPDAGPALRERVQLAVSAGRLAYETLADWLEHHYLPHARATDGVGADRYRLAMRRALGSTPDPEELYAWGWEELLRLQVRMKLVAQRVDAHATVDEVIHRLKNDPSFAAPDRASFLAQMGERQESALAAVSQHFQVPRSLHTLLVREAPAGGPPGAFYMPPSEDLSRPGSVNYSLAAQGPYPLWDQVSTAYHEGFPGHHLQCGLQVSMSERLCRLHRVAYGYAGFAEGWALYAEELMGELGHYERPEYELGMLANQLLRACRVVIDIGAHLDLPIPSSAPLHAGERWSFERAVELLEHSGMQPHVARSEVTRYLGWPGQAISYQVGKRVILDLREASLSRGGDLRDFHERVLACGNVGLDRVRSEVLRELPI